MGSSMNVRNDGGRILVAQGLLFKINREVLHPAGLALSVDPVTGYIQVFETDDPAGICYTLNPDRVDRAVAACTSRPARRSSAE